MNLLETGLALATGGGGVWVGNLLLERFRARDDRIKDERAAGINLEEHRDKLTFDLLAAARVEVSAARDEVAALRPAVANLAEREMHLEEALSHIDGLMNSETPEEVKAARRRATAFVNRMRRLADAKGAIINEVQRAVSGAALLERGKD